MKKIAIIGLAVGLVLLAGIATGCSNDGGDDNSDREAIIATIQDYVSSYNASNFEKCINYFTEYGDREDAKATLAYFRDLSGEMYIRVMSSDDPPMLAINILEIDKSTARVEIELTADEGGNQSIGSDDLYLKKVDGQWKIIWEQ